MTFDDISPVYLSTSHFESVLKALNEMGIPCTFFVVPGEDSRRFFDTDFKSCLRTAINSGHELSLHGCNHVKNEFGYLSVRSSSIPLSNIPLPLYNNQKKKLELATKNFIHITSMRPLGFRAPKYLYNNQTLIALSNLGFKYDSSKTVFKPTHGAHLRLRWLRNCKPRWSHGLIEIPVTGDYTFGLSKVSFLDSLNREIRDFEWAKSHNGVFVINNHPYSSDENLLIKFLRATVAALGPKTEFVRLVDVNLQ
jgi:predicted deacetylase